MKISESVENLRGAIILRGAGVMESPGVLEAPGILGGAEGLGRAGRLSGVRGLRGTIAFVLATVCLVLFTAGCITKTVWCMGRTGGREQADYREAEEQLVREVRQLLAEKGFENSGVALTSVSEEDKRSYTLTIHHRGIYGLEEKEKESLGREIDSLYFESENCIFCHEFLILK